MKNFLIFLLFIALLIGNSCKKPKNAVKESEAITNGYAKAKGIAKVPNKTRVLTELASLRQMIWMYQLEEGEFPESLSDLSVKVKDINEYEYDSEKGKVTSKYYPKL